MQGLGDLYSIKIETQTNSRQEAGLAFRRRDMVLKSGRVRCCDMFDGAVQWCKQFGVYEKLTQVAAAEGRLTGY